MLIHELALQYTHSQPALAHGSLYTDSVVEGTEMGNQLIYQWVLFCYLQNKVLMTLLGAEITSKHTFDVTHCGDGKGEDCAWGCAL